jgi:hypothetical protein
MQQGQGSGDFRETSGRVQLFHVTTRNSMGLATPDAFTQANPPIVTATANKSTTLASVTKVGVLGATIAFTRPDIGNGYHGGPVLIAAAYSVTLQPLGVFINDAIGNAFENTPGPASGKAPYVCGSGTCIGVSLWETQHLKTGSAAITYAAGNKLYASANGLFTNVLEDSYENQASGAPAPVVVGIVKIAPDANNSLMVIDLRI